MRAQCLHACSSCILSNVSLGNRANHVFHIRKHCIFAPDQWPFGQRARRSPRHPPRPGACPVSRRDGSLPRTRLSRYENVKRQQRQGHQRHVNFDRRHEWRGLLLSHGGCRLTKKKRFGRVDKTQNHALTLPCFSFTFSAYPYLMKCNSLNEFSLTYCLHRSVAGIRDMLRPA